MISKIKKIADYLFEPFLLSFIYYGFHFNKTGSFQLTELYTYFLAVFVFVWLSISTYLFDKNTRSFTSPFIAVVYQYFFSLFTLTLICSVTGFSDISRLFLLLVVSGAAALKLVFIVLRKYDRINLWEFSLLEKMERPSFPRLIASMSLLTVSFAAVQYLMPGLNDFVYKSHEPTLILLVAAWLFSSLLTNKFFPQTGRNIYYKVAPFLKSSVLMLFLLGAVFYLLRLEGTILKQDLFATALLFSSVESIFALLYFNTSKAVSEPVLTDKESHFSQSDLPLQANSNQDNSRTFLAHVRKIKYENLEDKIYDELNQVLAGHSISIGKFRILFDRADSNLRLIKPDSLGCIFNYSPVNDSRVINKSFSSSYEALVDHGFLIGMYTPQENDRRELERRMPRSVFVVYYPLHFVFKRLVPKLPYLSRLYNFVTSGKNRLISRAELLGRLAYAGFSVKNEIPINGKVLFI
nr:hypothetical protein [Bacteroidota bacterium]